MSMYTELKNMLFDNMTILLTVLPVSEAQYLLNKYSGIRQPGKKEMRKDLIYVKQILKLD